MTGTNVPKEVVKLTAILALGMFSLMAVVVWATHTAQHATGTCGGNCVHCP